MQPKLFWKVKQCRIFELGSSQFLYVHITYTSDHGQIMHKSVRNGNLLQK